MQWSVFYDNFYEWADTTRRTHISSLEDIGSGEEVVEVILEIADEKIRAQLIRKAMKFGTAFTSDDFANLDGELSDELYAQLGKYTGYDHNDPFFDEDNMTWDDFYCYYADWSDEILMRRVRKLREFGLPGEVADAILGMPNSETEDLLYQKAVAAGVRFSDEEMLAMGNLVDVLTKAMHNPPSEEKIHQTTAAQTTATRRPAMGAPKKVVGIQLLDVEDHGADVMVSYTQSFDNGTRKTRRRNVKDLGGYYQFFSAKPITAAQCVGKASCGILKSDVRILFIVKLSDGSAQLIQTREGSKESLKLLQLSEDANIQTPAAQVGSRAAQPYPLGKNELPQGTYEIGEEIPAGTYDFFVIYGTGGKFEIIRYDSSGRILDGTGEFFWVGLKESYEKRELIHISCNEGDTLKIGGNVILKIARSQKVRIEL